MNEIHGTSRFDWAIEIHFNSALNPKAKGTEVLYYSTKNAGVATRMSRAIASSLGTRDRGSKNRNNLGWLRKTDPPALIVEVLFINNKGGRWQDPRSIVLRKSSAGDNGGARVRNPRHPSFESFEPFGHADLERIADVRHHPAKINNPQP